MAGIRHQRGQLVSLPQGTLWMGRHFHQMDVHVQQTRVVPGPIKCGKCRVQHLDGFQSIGSLRRLATW